MALLKCSNCEIFFERASPRPDTKNFFCSMKCQAEWKKKHTKKISGNCRLCGKSFLLYKRSGVDPGFCSQKCYLKWKRPRIREENIARTKPIILSCEFCGSEITRNPSTYNRSKHHFCDKTCYGKWLHQLPDIKTKMQKIHAVYELSRDNIKPKPKRPENSFLCKGYSDDDYQQEPHYCLEKEFYKRSNGHITTRCKRCKRCHNAQSRRNSKQYYKNNREKQIYNITLNQRAETLAKYGDAYWQNHDWPKILADLLKKRTQRGLAGEIGTSQTQIWNWKSGNHKPTGLYKKVLLEMWNENKAVTGGSAGGD